jgi:hypothetical protein
MKMARRSGIHTSGPRYSLIRLRSGAGSIAAGARCRPISGVGVCLGCSRRWLGDRGRLDSITLAWRVAMYEFVIAPASGRAMWLILLVPGLILFVVIGIVGAAVIAARSARFEVSSAGLRLRGDVYGRLIPIEQLRGASAVRVDFAAAPELTPARRTMGTGLPGYRSGWFRLRNGDTALLYVTDMSRVVHVPTTAGYSVLLSPAEPDRFLAALRSVSAKP